MGPEHIVLGILASSLALYAVLGGADFGAGVWEFTTCMQSDPRDRKLIQRAIGPVWEANHVWLIFVLIILLNGFPLAFGALSRSLTVPMLLALLGIVFRGSGFVFRAYAVGSQSLQDLAGALFALASTATPFFLGASVGAISTGDLRFADDGKFLGDYATGWLGPLSLYTGVMAVGMCAYLAAVYLTREASVHDRSMLLVWRGRALSTGIWIGILAWLGLIMTWLDAKELWARLMTHAWPVILVSLITGAGSLFALRAERYRFANLMAASAVGSVIYGWGLAQYPMFIRPDITIEASKSPDFVLWAMSICILGGSVLLFPALWWLMVIFKRTSADAS